MPTKAILRHISVETPRTNHPRHCASHRRGKKAHSIGAGDTHLVIVEDDKKIRYCRSAAAEILDRAQRDLNALRSELGLQPASE
jgi:phage terminase small subunit